MTIHKKTKAVPGRDRYFEKPKEGDALIIDITCVYV